MSIALMEAYVPVLDEVYKLNSLTSVLDANQQLVSFDGKSFKVPQMTLQGLGDHVRGGSYVAGEASLTWETKTPDYDRDRKFSIDEMDNEETAGVAFGMLSGEFIRTKVVPEVDAVRFAKYYAAATAGSQTATPANLATGDAVIAALRVGTSALDSAEVPKEGRILYIEDSLKGLIDDIDETKSRRVLNRFSQIIEVPQARFYTAVSLLSGATGPTTVAGGYAKGASASDLNFLIIHPTAVIQAFKHVAPKYIPAAVNQNGANDEFAYRVYGINTYLDSKVKGFYGHAAGE